MRLGKTIRLALIALGCLAALAAIWLATLVFPAKPSAARSLVFDGFIGLPASEHGAALSILDYLSISGRTLFVTSESDGAVYEVALDASPAAATASVRTALGPPAAHGVVVDPVSGLAFVSRSGANRVDAFDPVTLKIVKSIPVANDVDGIFFDPKNQLIYAVHGDPHLASVIDPKASASVSTIDLGSKPEAAAYDQGAGVFYQALNDANAIAVLDLARRSVMGRFPLPGCIGPTSVAADLANQRLFVVCSDNSQLVVVDLATHGVVAHLHVGGAPDSVAYDASLRRLYSTGKSGVLSVIQQDGADRYHTLDTVKMHYGAHTLAVDPVTHRVYVGYASLFVAPRLAVFSPRH